MFTLSLTKMTSRRTTRFLGFISGQQLTSSESVEVP